MTLPTLFIDNDGVLTDAYRMGPAYGHAYGEIMAPIFGGTVEEWAEANAAGFEMMMEWYHANCSRYEDASYFDDLYRVNLEGAFRHMGREPVSWDGEGRLLNRRILFECPARVDTLFPGAREAVRTLHARGYRTNMASNAHSLHCEGTLAGAGLRSYFMLAFGPDLVDRPVKSTEFYRLICAYVGVRPENAVVVDDNGDALAMAAEAGTRTIFVDQGHSRHPPLTEPDAVVNAVGELPEAVARLHR